MESFEDSNCLSMSDSFSLYERYMRSFNVVSSFSEGNEVPSTTEPASVSSSYDSSRGSNVDFVAIENCNKLGANAETVECSIRETEILCDKKSNIDLSTPPPVLFESSSTTVEHSLTEKSDAAEAPISSEDSKGDCPKQPVFITPTMENSNNAVDSVPLFLNVRATESVFKLPISELSFNGTIKHVQKLQPIVDPITALSSAGTGLLELDRKSVESSNTEDSNIASDRESDVLKTSISNEKSTLETSEGNKSSGDSQYEELNQKKRDGNSKWKLDHSSSSYEASIDSGVRSPDMFSEDDDDEQISEPNTFWNFLKDYEAHDKRKVKKLEEKLAALSPFRSKKTFTIDASEMLRKYYTFLPAFTKDYSETEASRETNARTPIKQRPEQNSLNFSKADAAKESVVNEQSLVKDDSGKLNMKNSRNTHSKDLEVEQNKNDSLTDASIILEMGCEDDAKESWPDVLKCKYHDVYYNITKYSEKLESLTLRYGEKYIRAETSSSFNVNAGGLPSPNTVKRQKAQQKLAQPTSLGSRLSHIANRRMVFNREKPLTLKSNMILVEKTKPKSTMERRSPRLRRTPSKRTPVRDGSAKKKIKTPKSRSSSTKKAKRKSLGVPQSRESFKRALFVSPESKKTASSAPISSAPQLLKARECSLDSPDAAAETQSLDGALRDIFLKRKRSALDDEPDDRRSKVAKSLSFGGAAIDRSQQFGLNRRASELPAAKTTGLNERHKQKLLWAVSEALRVHGWRMTSPGFRDKAAALARLTRRLLSLPPHAARLADPRLNTSDTILKLARQYVFAIIQGRSIDDCFQEEQMKISNETNNKVVGYITAAAYRELKEKQATSTIASQIKENACNDTKKTEIHRNAPKNVLQDKLLNIDSNSSSISLSGLDKVEIYKSNSMPSFEEAAKMRARRQISFDNIDFPKR